jgi:hypothetical protein
LSRNEEVGRDTVVVIPIGPTCQTEYVADTIESIRHFAPLARLVLVDDSRRGMGIQLGERYELTSVEARAHGVFGNLYLNLSAGFREALQRPFRILIRLDTDAIIAGSDFEAKAIERFNSDEWLGSLGSFRVTYDGAQRDGSWAKRRILFHLAVITLVRPNEAIRTFTLLRRAHRHGYRLGESIMGGAVIYRYEAVAALNEANLLGRVDIAKLGVHEDHIFGLCLPSVGYHLGEFGNKYDDEPMGVDWKGLPAPPSELIELRKSIIHSTKFFEAMDERAIREEFRRARGQR